MESTKPRKRRNHNDHVLLNIAPAIYDRSHILSSTKSAYVYIYTGLYDRSHILSSPKSAYVYILTYLKYMKKKPVYIYISRIFLQKTVENTFDLVGRKKNSAHVYIHRLFIFFRPTSSKSVFDWFFQKLSAYVRWRQCAGLSGIALS